MNPAHPKHILGTLPSIAGTRNVCFFILHFWRNTGVDKGPREGGGERWVLLLWGHAYREPILTFNVFIFLVNEEECFQEGINQYTLKEIQWYAFLFQSQITVDKSRVIHYLCFNCEGNSTTTFTPWHITYVTDVVNTCCQRRPYTTWQSICFHLCGQGRWSQCEVQVIQS